MLILYNFRFLILDVILHAVEALSTIDGYSQEISSNKELFQLVSDLVKLPDKVEVKCILLKTDWIHKYSTILIYEIVEAPVLFHCFQQMFLDRILNFIVITCTKFGNQLHLLLGKTNNYLKALYKSK